MSGANRCAPDCDERTNCPKVGGAGHYFCGVCPIHETPRHHCGCAAPGLHEAVQSLQRESK